MAKPTLWVRYAQVGEFEIEDLGLKITGERDLTKEIGYSDLAESEDLYNNIPNLEFSYQGGLLWNTLEIEDVENILSTFTLDDYNNTDIASKKRNNFPSGVQKGHIITHNILNDTFVCINGLDEGANTSLQINWKSITISTSDVEGINVKTTGQPSNKVLISDGSNGMIYGDISGGFL